MIEPVSLVDSGEIKFPISPYGAPRVEALRLFDDWLGVKVTIAGDGDSSPWNGHGRQGTGGRTTLIVFEPKDFI